MVNRSPTVSYASLCDGPTPYRARLLTATEDCGTIAKDLCGRFHGENVVGDGARRELQDAVNRIQRLSDEYWYALDPSCNLMEDKAWLGPSGGKLDDALHDDRRELRAQLARAVESARASLASLPRP